MVSALQDGRVSSKAWARLRPNEHGGGSGSQKSKMADFNAKTKNDGRGSRGDKAGGVRHIDHKQGMGTPATAGGKATAGMASKGPTPTVRHIEQNQKPLWPKGSGKTGKPVTGGTTNPSRPRYGGPSRRQAPQRI